MFVCVWISEERFTRLDRALCGHGAALKVQLVLIAVWKRTYKILLVLLCFVFVGSIVSVGDPKKKYTCFEKIGQGFVYSPPLFYTFPYAEKEALKPGKVTLLEKLLVMLWRVYFVWLLFCFLFILYFLGGCWLFWWVLPLFFSLSWQSLKSQGLGFLC